MKVPSWWFYFPYFRDEEVAFERLSDLCKAVEVVKLKVGSVAPDLEFFAFCVGPHCLSKKRRGHSLIGHNELLFSSDEDPYQSKWTNCLGVFGPTKPCDTLVVGGEREILF